MADNPFVLPTEQYKRDLRPVHCYAQDAATYISKMTGAPVEECLTFVRETIRPGSASPMAMKDPVVTYLERDANGDRTQKQSRFSEYLVNAIRSEELIAPTFTTYLPPSQKKSLLVDFIDGNVLARSKAKKEMFSAVAEGNKPVATFKKIEQTGKKLANNALSGAHVSASTPLYNKTAHSTLTSNCRSTSGFGNANNEKLLCGNRHYWSPDIARANLLSIINHTDYAAQAAVMSKYGIRAPSVQETMDCLLHSTDLYWRGKKEHAELHLLISRLSDAERAAFVYTGDLFHLRKCNEKVVRDFIDRLSSKIIPTASRWAAIPWKEVKDYLKQFPEDQWFLAAQICAGHIREKTKNGKIEELAGQPEMDIFVATVENIFNTLQAYRDLIQAFWVTDNVPASLAHFPDSIRRAAITSDTDSTIFTVQEWVIWHQDGLKFSEYACGLAATMIFLASQTITHVLARMSANFGIEQKRLHQVAMKNEYYFPVFVPTQVAKHYYALIAVQEGLVFKEFDKEIKGVHLKSSNAPRMVMKEAEKLMIDIMMTVYNEKPISIVEVMRRVAKVEHEVMDAIRRGSHEYFRKGQIKTPDSYVDAEAAPPYQQYLLWNEVFAPKYGEMPPPPYLSVKVNAELDSPAKVKDWLAKMKDQVFAGRMQRYMEATGKKHLGTTLMLPEPIVGASGLPEEILVAMDMRKMVLDATKVFYLILETLGVYMLNSKTTRLVSDEF
jgi:hypothetical protein